jgi:hypothetical protein
MWNTLRFWDVLMFSLVDTKLLEECATSIFECWYISTKLHGITSQKAIMLIFTTMRTSNPNTGLCSPLHLFHYLKRDLNILLLDNVCTHTAK